MNGRGVPFLFATFLLGAMLAACSADPPKIVNVVPGRGAGDVPTNQNIRIDFDRPMDQASVESRFDLQPILVGCAGTSRCRFGWNRDALIFTHTGVNFEPSTTYTVVLHGGYADLSGRHDSFQRSWTFTTEGLPTLQRIDPGNRSTAIAQDRNVVLTFNRPMEVTSVQAAIHVDPDVPFVLRTRPGDTSQFEIVPLTVLQPNTQYTISMEGALDTHHNTMVGRVESRFKTGPVSLARKLGYLIGQRGQPAFGVAVVDPHPDSFLDEATPKQIFALSDTERLTASLLGFDWAPDGQRLVVIENSGSAAEGRVFTVNLLTGLTHDLGVEASQVYWAPDGSSIVYRTHATLRQYQLSAARDLTLVDDLSVRAPITFSPDGKFLAFAADDPPGTPRLFIYNLDLHSRYGPPGLTDSADLPSWSPDGTKVAFRRATATGPEVWVYDLNASGASALFRAAALDVQALTWLNDNGTVVVGVGDGPMGSLYRVNIFAAQEAGGVVKVTGTADAPNGSTPDAPLYDRRIGYVAMIDGVPQICVMNADGSRPQQLTHWAADFPYTGFAPSWSPAGQ
jgi:Bacterial Ig-like domain/WD40-like Beta Propeller Repeat